MAAENPTLKGIAKEIQRAHNFDDMPVILCLKDLSKEEYEMLTEEQKIGMEKVNGICIEGRFYEAVLTEEFDSCDGCELRETPSGCYAAPCHSFKRDKNGDAEHIFRYSPELTERLKGGEK